MDEGCDELCIGQQRVAVRRIITRRSRAGVAGFSLTELLVSVGILGVLAAFTLPSLGGFVGQNRITATTNEFVYSLQLARSEAIKRIAPVVLCPSNTVADAAPVCAVTGYEAGWIVYVDSNRNGTSDAGEPVIWRVEAQEGVVNFASTGVATRVRFNATGASVQDSGAPLPGTVTITFGDKGRLVNVRANGRVDSRVL